MRVKRAVAAVMALVALSVGMFTVIGATQPVDDHAPQQIQAGESDGEGGEDWPW
ncbi:MAG TPA: hypothetical protein VNP92_02050 [Actinophytocola sp.]|nr:hypothetical protein [Actinophytocola sp.]